MKNPKLRLLLVLLLAVLALAPTAATAVVADEPIPSFDAWLVAVSGPLAGAAVALLLSWVVEYVPAYENLAPRWKRLVYFAMCLVVPVSAALLRAALGYVAFTFDPLVWHALWNGFGAFGVGTVAHVRKLPTMQTLL